MIILIFYMNLISFGKDYLYCFGDLSYGVYIIGKRNFVKFYEFYIIWEKMCSFNVKGI